MAVARAPRFRGAPALDDASVRAKAERRVAGFRALDVAVAEATRGMLFRSDEGTLVFVLPFGDGRRSRVRGPGVQLAPDRSTLIVDLGELMLAEGRLCFDDPPVWLPEATA